MDTSGSIRNDKASSKDARVSIVTVSERNEHDSISREEFQTWLDGFRARYADALEYQRSH